MATEENWPELRQGTEQFRIGLAPVMLTPAGPAHCAARRIAWRRAKFWPTIRAWSGITCAAIWLRSCSGAECRSTAFIFGRGGGLGRSASAPPCRKAIAWWKGRACTPERPRVAVLSPYFPYPLSHGGAVRIYQPSAGDRARIRRRTVRFHGWRRRAGNGFDSGILRARGAGSQAPIPRAALVDRHTAGSARVSLAGHGRAIAKERGAFGFQVLQVEYTQLAPIWRRHPGGARRDLRPFRPDRAPRANACGVARFFPSNT